MGASWALCVVASARLLVAPSAIPAHGPVVIPWPNDTPDAPTDRKGKFCDVNFQPSNESRRLMHALNGRQISVAVNLHPHGQQLFNFVSYDTRTGMLRGYLVDVMDEMARRGNFTWRNSFVLVDVPGEQLPFDVMSWAVENYDIFVDWRTISKEMEARGMSALMPFLDTSYHLLLKPDIIAPTLLERVFSYLRPFALDTWLMFVFCWLVTACAYCKFEAGQGDFQGPGGSDRPFMHSAYLSALVITSAGGPQPTTCAGKFMSLTYAGLIVLIIAAYTANLATLLVVNARVTIPIQSLDQAAAQRVEVCTAYPESFDYFEDYSGTWRVKTRAIDVYTAVAAGDCKVGMVRSHMWHVARHNRETNPDCSLYMIPEPSKKARSGFVVRVDKPGHFTCIENAAQVFNLILLDMAIDDFFHNLRRKHTHAPHPIHCPRGLPGALDGDSASLTLRSAGGMFLSYVLCVPIAYIVYRIEKPCRPGKNWSCHRDESDSTSEATSR